MRAKQVVLFTGVCIVLCWITAGKAQVPGQKAPARLYNTAKQKPMEGKQIVGATVFSPDPNIYCAMANAGYDFLWIEMQHSPLTFEDVARMIWACRGAPAMPFICVPDATESDIPKAADIGAVGCASARIRSTVVLRRMQQVSLPSRFVPSPTIFVPFRAVGECEGQLPWSSAFQSISPFAPPTFAGFNACMRRSDFSTGLGSSSFPSPILPPRGTCGDLLK